jgi:hypothetical protein
MLKRRDVHAEHELDRKDTDFSAAAAVPQFLADALAWMEVQRVGLARLQAYQLDDVVEVVS